MIESLLHYQFLQNAVIVGILISIICGIMGSFIVEKKLVMMTGGIAHTSYGGVGLGYLMGFEPVAGAFIVSILAAFGIGYINRKGAARSDVVTGLFWSSGMAAGVIFVGLMPGYPPDLSSYLFGNILSVKRSDLYFTGFLTLLIVIIAIALFDYWKAYMFDEEFAHIIGINTEFLEYLLLIMIAFSVVALIRVVGIILVIALFTAPAAIAGLFLKDLKGRMIFSTVAGIVFCMGGLFVSFKLNVASGASIVVFSVIGFIVAYFVSLIIKKVKQ